MTPRDPTRMDPPVPTPDPERERRRLLRLIAWGAAIVWSVYLVSKEVSSSEELFQVAVQTMGSMGILYALYLVTRPRGAGVLSGLRGDAPSVGEGDDHEPSSSAARWAIVTITLALAIGGIAYRLTQDNYLHQSAAFFIGVPAVLAITLSLTPKAKSATGMIVKGLTLALLLSGIVFAEGFICILMAAPLFYLVGIVIGVPIDRLRRRREAGGRVYSIVGFAVLLLSLEGVTPATTVPQREVVRATKVVDGSVSEVRAALASTPDFDAPLPVYLRLGFPTPVSARGAGLALGDRRTIVFGTESPMEPMASPRGGSAHDHHADAATGGDATGGTLEMRVTRSGKRTIVFETVEDATAFTHWISWGRSIVRWRSIDDDKTEVTWTMSFRRRLSPAWYFGPWQRYAARHAASYLIETVATP